jgi:hypothetical protein
MFEISTQLFFKPDEKMFKVKITAATYLTIITHLFYIISILPYQMQSLCGVYHAIVGGNRYTKNPIPLHQVQYHQKTELFLKQCQTH